MGYFVLGTMSVLGVLTAASPSLVGADSGTTTTGKWTGVCVGTAGTVASDVATLQGIQCLLANLLGAVLTLFAFVGFFMFIWASFKLMVSNGQPEKFTKAKDTMTYAIFGFILALSSFAIINILAYFTGIDSFLAIQFGGQTAPESATSTTKK
ncbi:hypothetical protein IJJ27_00575 [bacterium]|nr:hypothetical protein [bacterium]MBQ6436043.1 hypothetical protein [bacterium]